MQNDTVMMLVTRENCHSGGTFESLPFKSSLATTRRDIEDPWIPRDNEALDERKRAERSMESRKNEKEGAALKARSLVVGHLVCGIMWS